MKTVTMTMQPSVIKMLVELVDDDIRKAGDSQTKSGKVSDLIKEAHNKRGSSK